MAESIGTHPDLAYKAQVDAIADKQDGDVYVYPSLVELGESDVWHPVIHGEGENTLDLGGQFAPNTVAIKQLAGRTNHNQNRINKLEKLGGIKNLWIDGGMSIWADGDSGNIVGSGGQYQYGITIIRGVDLVGGIGTWERVVENDRQWLKITHQGATAEGYIGRRWERDTLQFLKGKTVTLSFDYKCGQDVKGWMNFYNEQGVIHDGIGNNMALEQFQYVGDNELHRAEITVTLPNDNLVPDDNSYFGIQIGYGDNSDGHSGFPDGSLYITNVQLEVNNKATDFEHKPTAIDQLLHDRYYQKSPSWVTGHRIDDTMRRVIIPHSFPVPMRKVPQLNFIIFARYNNSGVSIGIDYTLGTTNKELCSYIIASEDLANSAYMVKYTANARIY